METKYLKCNICGVIVAGAGVDNAKKNLEQHKLQQHKVEEIISELEVIIDNVEVVEPIEYSKKDLQKMFKDELIDLSAKLGLEDEVKYNFTKAKIINIIWKNL